MRNSLAIFSLYIIDRTKSEDSCCIKRNFVYADVLQWSPNWWVLILSYYFCGITWNCRYINLKSIFMTEALKRKTGILVTYTSDVGDTIILCLGNNEDRTARCVVNWDHSEWQRFIMDPHQCPKCIKIPFLSLTKFSGLRCSLGVNKYVFLFIRTARNFLYRYCTRGTHIPIVLIIRFHRSCSYRRNIWNVIHMYIH